MIGSSSNIIYNLREPTQIKYGLKWRQLLMEEGLKIPKLEYLSNHSSHQLRVSTKIEYCSKISQEEFLINNPWSDLFLNFTLKQWSDLFLNFKLKLRWSTQNWRQSVMEDDLYQWMNANKCQFTQALGCMFLKPGHLFQRGNS